MKSGPKPPHKPTARHLRVGKTGEDAACVFLSKHGYSIIERNYRKKWGEIDIVALRENELHFIEVKTLRAKTQKAEDRIGRPEENAHPWKIRKLHRTIATYICEKKINDTPWQLDLITVILHMDTRIAKVRMLRNIVG
jgi:putative endonuclease